MAFTQQIAAEKRAFAWYLRTYGKSSYRRIADECGISKSSAHRICSNEFQHGSLTRMPSDKKRGRPRNVSQRKMRLLIRTLKSFRRNNIHVTVRSLVEESGLSFQVASRRTYSRYLNELGYYYFSARRKGILSDNDKKVRLQFARKMKQELIRNPDFWKNEISFSLPFTWTGYRLFTSITRKVVRPLTEPGCGENERKGFNLQPKDVKI